jgi:transcriptional regulator with XRE-family HTH domain
MSDQVTNGRRLVRPGATLKALRIQKGWSLAELSRRTGMPISSLSKVENDKMELTLDRLMRVSAALEADIPGLFTPPSAQYAKAEASGRRSLTRAGEGKIVDSPIGRYQFLAYDMLNKGSLPLIIDVTARSLEEFGEFNRHPGEELVLVLEGEIDLYTSMYLPMNLKKGDSLYFDSSMGHAYVAAGEGPCRIFSICIAPDADFSLLEAKSLRDHAPAAR